MIDEYIPTALLFYSLLSDEDIAYINDKLTSQTNNELYELLSKNSDLIFFLEIKLNCFNAKKRSLYIKHLNSLKDDAKLLSGGLDVSKFIL